MMVLVKHALIFTLFSCSGMLFGQNLPSFKGIEKDSVYTYLIHSYKKHTIDIRGSKSELIEVKAAGANIQKLNDSTYHLMFTQPMEETKVKLYYKNLPVDIIIAKVINIEMPVIKLANSSFEKISKSNLAAVKNFQIDYKQNPLYLGFEFYNCVLTISDKNKKEPIRVNLNSLEFPASVAGIIQQLPVNSTISFKNIQVKTPANSVLNVEGDGVNFTIVE